MFVIEKFVFPFDRMIASNDFFASLLIAVHPQFVGVAVARVVLFVWQSKELRLLLVGKATIGYSSMS